MSNREVVQSYGSLWARRSGVLVQASPQLLRRVELEHRACKGRAPADKSLVGFNVIRSHAALAVSSTKGSKLGANACPEAKQAE